MELQETVQITTLAEVTPERSSQFGLPKARNFKSPYISESSSDASDDNSYKVSIGRSDDESLEMEHVTGREDSRKAARLRTIMVLLFFPLCSVVPAAIYITTRKNEVDGFEAAFTRLAAKVIDSVEFQLTRKLSALDSFRIAITSHALSTNTSWPFVTTPDYDLRANSARDLGDMLSVTFHPFVSPDIREAWENYTVDNIEWLWQAQARHPTASRDRMLNEKDGDLEDEAIFTEVDFSNGFSKDIYTFDSSKGVMIDTSGGPYLPAWQTMPPDPGLINFNALSDPITFEAAGAMVSAGKAVISRIANLEKIHAGDSSSELIANYYTQLLQDHLSDPDAEYRGEPLATIYYPIFDQFDREARQLVGMFSASIAFELFFTDLLVAESNGVLCVVENGCGDVVSYEIQGEDAIFLGYEDLHDREFDYIEQSYDFASVGESKVYSSGEKTVLLHDEYCPYTLRVYPVRGLREEYVTSQPIVYATTMAIAILFMAIVSLSYDYIVQRRMKRVLKTAKESRAIVHSLFPANVRDRLLKEEEERSQQRSADGGSNAGGRLFPRRGSMDTRSIASTARRNSNETGITEMLQQPFNTAVGAVTSFAALPAKLRLKFFLNESSHGAGTTYPLDPKPPGEECAEDKPIADLFPNCTVLFADISGFTAWSSEREPEQVFTLLQTIFKTFDQLARKRDIFKVETIGDCYVAVTGLPDPQADHAVRMTKFARACMQKVSEITAELETKLGPGTGTLRMRFGLHSGPVTAGVLRGEKSRFQLFGDTVNTASRMESTGMRNRIQLSPSTAELLIEAGKENWIQAREDLVQAKGKGSIQTYWALTNRRDPGSQDLHVEEGPKFIKSALSTEDSDSDSDSVESGYDSVWGDDDDLGGSTSILDLPETAMQSQYDRLIDWQVDIMVRLLKQVIAGRAVDRKVRFDLSEAVTLDGSIRPLQEVTTNIELPKFDPKAAKLRASPSLFEVPEEVIRELHQFVRMIAVRYRNNPFHNFAHASHVTMSANKLLSRIVQPEDVNYHRKSVKAIASDLHDYTYGITSDPLTQFAVMFSTLVHDVDHSGVSNAQRGKECPELAAKYKDRSVAEQNSVDIAWNLLMEPCFENLQQCIFATESELKRFRQLLVNLVMATDIFDREMKETRNMRWEKVFHSDLADSMEDAELRSLKAMIVIEHIIQAADVAHTMQHWHVYKKWNQRLFEEMYQAYKNGRSEKDPSEGWYNGELWFFDNYVIPLARKLEECGVFGVASDECLNYALENRKEWAVKGKEVVQEMVEKFKESEKASVNSFAVLASQDDEIVFEVRSPAPTPKSQNPTLGRTPSKMSPILADTSPSLKTAMTAGLHGIDSILKFTVDLDADSESSSTESSSEPLDSPFEISESNHLETDVETEYSC